MKKNIKIFCFITIGIILCVFVVIDDYDFLHKISELILGSLSLFIGYAIYKGE